MENEETLEKYSYATDSKAKHTHDSLSELLSVTTAIVALGGLVTSKDIAKCNTQSGTDTRNSERVSSTSNDPTATFEWPHAVL